MVAVTRVAVAVVVFLPDHKTWHYQKGTIINTKKLCFYVAVLCLFVCICFCLFCLLTFVCVCVFVFAFFCLFGLFVCFNERNGSGRR